MDKIEDLKAAIETLEEEATENAYKIDDLKNDIEDLEETIRELKSESKSMAYDAFWELQDQLEDVFENLEKVEKLEIFLNFIDSFNIDDLRALEKTKKRIPKIKINAD